MNEEKRKKEEKRKEVRPVWEKERRKERRNERRSDIGERKRNKSTVREMREVINFFFIISFELCSNFWERTVARWQVF